MIKSFFQKLVSVNKTTSSDFNNNFRQPSSQQFAFRTPIINYILKNPSGKAWKTLIKTCKYFFPKYPVFPVKNLWICRDTGDKWQADKEYFDTKKNPQLWVYDVIYIHTFHNSVNLLSSIMPKLCKCDLRILNITSQILTLDNYNILTSSGTCNFVALIQCQICHSDRSHVTVDKLFENLHNVKEFSLIEPKKVFQTDTVKNMVQIFQRLSKLRYVKFNGITENFDFSSISDFLMKNETIMFNLFFIVPTNDYKQLLENFIDKLMKNPPKVMPYIWFPGFHNVRFKEYIIMCL